MAGGRVDAEKLKPGANGLEKHFFQNYRKLRTHPTVGGLDG